MNLLTKAWIGVKYEFKAIKRRPRYLCLYYLLPLIIIMFVFGHKLVWWTFFLKKNVILVSIDEFIPTLKNSIVFLFAIYMSPIIAILTKTINYIETSFHQFLQVLFYLFQGLITLLDLSNG